MRDAGRRQKPVCQEGRSEDGRAFAAAHPSPAKNAGMDGAPGVSIP